MGFGAVLRDQATSSGSSFLGQSGQEGFRFRRLQKNALVSQGSWARYCGECGRVCWGLWESGWVDGAWSAIVSHPFQIGEESIMSWFQKQLGWNTKVRATPPTPHLHRPLTVVFSLLSPEL